MKNLQTSIFVLFCVSSVLAQNYTPTLMGNVLCDVQTMVPKSNAKEYTVWLRPMHNQEKSPGELAYLTVDFSIQPILLTACRISVEPVANVPFITTGTAVVESSGCVTLGFTLTQPGQVTQVRVKIEDYVSGEIVFEKIVNIRQTFTNTALKPLASDPHGSGDL